MGLMGLPRVRMGASVCGKGNLTLQGSAHERVKGVMPLRFERLRQHGRRVVCHAPQGAEAWT